MDFYFFFLLLFSSPVSVPLLFSSPLTSHQSQVYLSLVYHMATSVPRFTFSDLPTVVVWLLTVVLTSDLAAFQKFDSSNIHHICTDHHPSRAYTVRFREAHFSHTVCNRYQLAALEFQTDCSGEHLSTKPKQTKQELIKRDGKFQMIFLFGICFVGFCWVGVFLRVFFSATNLSECSKKVIAQPQSV